MANNQIQQDVISLLKKANHVLVLPSSPIDGDSIGSALSLYLVLKKLGKKVTVVAEEAIPANYNFLPEISVISRELNFIRDFIVTIDCRTNPMPTIRQEIQGNKINIIVTPQTGVLSKDQVSFSEGNVPYDCIVTVDAADPVQLGKNYENFTELFHLVPVINIDHHASNLAFGKINFVDIMASSTTSLILPLVEALAEPNTPSLVDADVATLLLAGLITDTSSFQNPNTTPDAFAIAAKLIGYGARQQEIIHHIYKTKKLSTLKLWGRTLSKIQYDETHRLVWSVLTVKDFADVGGSPDETEGVIDELMSNAPGAEIVFLLKEKGPQEASGSIRTLTPTIDASKLAGLFGGGGHTQAAGFKMPGKTISEVEQMVVAGLRDFQKKRLRLPGTTSPDVATTTPTAPAVAPTPQPTVQAVTSPTPVVAPQPQAAPAPTRVVAPPMPLPPKPPVPTLTPRLIADNPPPMWRPMPQATPMAPVQAPVSPVAPRPAMPPPMPPAAPIAPQAAPAPKPAASLPTMWPSFSAPPPQPMAKQPPQLYTPPTPASPVVPQPATTIPAQPAAPIAATPPPPAQPKYAPFPQPPGIF